LRIQAIVEGQGDEKALPVLLRRFQAESGCFDLVFNRPLRKRRAEIVNELHLRATVRIALRQTGGCHGILILFDSDRDCPLELAPRIQSWAAAEAGRIPCEAVLAHCEYESWFLASLQSLRGARGVRADATPYMAPESVRGAKEKLEASMVDGRTYSETLDQAALTAAFDMAAAYRSCRSFRRMVSAFGKVAAGAGAPLSDWPPASWSIA
jgi:hypothetical protein